MSIILIDKDRNVIPRWRDFKSTVSLGELVSSAVIVSRSRQVRDLSLLRLDFEQNRTPAFAADLISAALVASERESALEAAEFVVSEVEATPSNESLLGMARTLLRETTSAVSANLQEAEAGPNALQPRISALRNHLKRFPEDAVSWVDLSLLFARSGLPAKANRAMLSALGLEPMSRFVLRSASRLFIHIGDLDKARDLLRRSPLVKTDPWINAAEIAVSLAASRQPSSVDIGISALKHRRFAWHDATELAVALATLEWRAGNNRNARRFLGLALNRPNENSLAQANHIAKDLPGSVIDTTVERFPVDRAFEVSFAQAYSRFDWASAGASAVAWLNDQPFSSRPAIAASYVYGSLLDDYATAEIYAKQGQLANPDDPQLNIELAFIYASTNRTGQARAELAKLSSSTIKDGAIFLLANHGLIAYRERDIGKGRKFYLDALKMAQASANAKLEAQALLFWAREEIHARTHAEGPLLSAAEEAVQRSDAPEAPFLLEKMKYLSDAASDQIGASVPSLDSFPTIV